MKDVQYIKIKIIPFRLSGRRHRSSGKNTVDKDLHVTSIEVILEIVTYEINHGVRREPRKEA